MSERLWHVEHVGGREWMADEVDSLATILRQNQLRDYSVKVGCEQILISEYGQLYLMDTEGDVWPIGKGDMVVVKDE